MEAVLTPVNGYLVLSNSLPISIASEISFLNLPRLLFLSATIFMLVTISLIISKKRYPGDVKYFLGLAIVLSPANPEVFAVTGYSFWWTLLWPLLLLFNRGTNVPLSAALLLISGLSGLTAGILSVLYLVRWRQKKESSYLVYLAVLLATSIIQFLILLTSPRLGN